MEPTLEGLDKFDQEFQVRDETNVTFNAKWQWTQSVPTKKPCWHQWVGVERWQSDSFARVRELPVHSQVPSKQVWIPSSIPAMRN